MAATAMETFTSATYGVTTMHDYRVTHGLLELHRDGHGIEPDLYFAAALWVGWRGPEAVPFWKVAKEVAKGVKSTPKHHHREDILSHWRSEVHNTQ